jgi:hypothetical protein
VHAMSPAARLAWRLLALTAFAGTAALAVTLSARGPKSAGLEPNRSPQCPASATRLHVRAIAGHIELAFTNVSRRSCELRGYPDVTLAGYGITRTATGRLASLVQTVVLQPGGTAHADVELLASRCRTYDVIGGLRVGLPGYPIATYVRQRLTICASTPQGATLLRVGAIEPGIELRSSRLPAPVPGG